MGCAGTHSSLVVLGPVVRVFQVARPRQSSWPRRRQVEFVARVRGHEVAWGSDTGGQHRRRSLRKGRVLHRWIARCQQLHELDADTAVSIEREVVSGHAYAVLTPETRCPGRCGCDKPMFPSVDGVSVP